MTYDQDRVRAGASSLFAQKVTPVRVSPLAQPGGLEVPELVVPTHLRVPGLVRPVRRGDLGRAAVALRPSARLTHAVKLPAGLAGSYTLRVHALMVNAQTGCRFERVAAQSFVVGDRG